MWETVRNNADWECFRTPILPEILKIPCRRQKEFCGSRTFVPISLVRKKQTAVSHSSTESEVMSFDVLDLLDLVSEVLHSPSPSRLCPERTGALR